MNWQAVGERGGDGLVPLEEWNEEGEIRRRLAADVRGGVAWPWPVQVGARLVAAGAVVVLGFDPPRETATLLSCESVGSVMPLRDADGWPVDGGVVGALREAATRLRCGRFCALVGDDDQQESLRAVRKALQGDLPALRVTALGAVTPDVPRSILWRWATARRLELGDAVVAAVEREESEPAAPQPVTLALAAALEGWERRPWRESRKAGWTELPMQVPGL